MGGQSTRMETDKAFLKINDQFYYQKAAQVLAPFCQEVLLSVNKTQAQNHVFEFPTITDHFENQGPMGGIWLWSVIGFGLGALHLYKTQTSVGMDNVPVVVRRHIVSHG